MGTFNASPSVEVRELDKSGFIQTEGSSTGAFVGAFPWGPVNQVVLVANEGEIVSTFGEPTANNYEWWFTAADYLNYSNSLKIVRVVCDDATAGTSAANATADAAWTSGDGQGLSEGNIIGNVDDYENLRTSLSATVKLAAKYPGALGNSLLISMCPATAFDTWEYEDYFDKAPTGSNRHIIIIDEDGAFTGTSGAVLEVFSDVSETAGTKNADGTSAYYPTVMESSAYVWALDDTFPELNIGTDGDTHGGTEDGDIYEASFLGGADGTETLAALTSSLLGRDGSAGTIGELATGWQLFADKEEEDIDFIIAGPTSGNSHIVLDRLFVIAEARQDCLVCYSPEKDDVVNVAFANQLSYVQDFKNSLDDTNYAVADCNWKYIYDKYNNTYRWIPMCASIAGLMAQTDVVADPWFSPAGYNRGNIKNVIKIAYNPSKAHRDELYKISVNPVVKTSGSGIILLGDRTSTLINSAFREIGIRRLFIVLEKNIAREANFELFEINDEITRSTFKAKIDPFLRTIQSRRGIEEFLVVCDSSNNTAEVVQRREFVADIYIKPTHSINWIKLNFVAVASTLSFEEIIG
jgi:phage tail sheath protein FI